MTLPATPRDYKGNGNRHKGEHEEYEDARLHAGCILSSALQVTGRPKPRSRVRWAHPLLSLAPPGVEQYQAHAREAENVAEQSNTLHINCLSEWVPSPIKQ